MKPFRLVPIAFAATLVVGSFPVASADDAVPTQLKSLELMIYDGDASFPTQDLVVDRSNSGHLQMSVSDRTPNDNDRTGLSVGQAEGIEATLAKALETPIGKMKMEERWWTWGDWDRWPAGQTLYPPQGAVVAARFQLLVTTLPGPVKRRYYGYFEKTGRGLEQALARGTEETSGDFKTFVDGLVALMKHDQDSERQGETERPNETGRDSCWKDRCRINVSSDGRVTLTTKPVGVWEGVRSLFGSKPELEVTDENFKKLLAGLNGKFVDVRALPDGEFAVRGKIAPDDIDRARSMGVVMDDGRTWIVSRPQGPSAIALDPAYRDPYDSTQHDPHHPILVPIANLVSVDASDGETDAATPANGMVHAVPQGS